MAIKTPDWIAEEELLSLVRHDLQLKLAYYESRRRTFRSKHQQSLTEFENSIRGQKKEDFDQWEDFMDWETADSACSEMRQRLQELDTWKT